jgi:hypothetical protein
MFLKFGSEMKTLVCLCKKVARVVEIVNSSLK